MILKKNAHHEMFGEMLFFFFANLCQGNFLYCPRFSILTKTLILPALVLKRNKISCIEHFLIKVFVSFVKILNIILEEYSPFLSHVK